MPFMLLTLVVIVVIAITAFLSTSPRVANGRQLLVFNIVVLALSVPAALAVGFWIYGDAVAAKADEKGMAVYLTIMAGGTAALLVVAIGGLVRNFLVFPRSRRLPAPPPEFH
jgi:uncharacterized membrane protein YoaT (DUF817 family)